jgi:hypothetical protein
MNTVYDRYMIGRPIAIGRPVLTGLIIPGSIVRREGLATQTTFDCRTNSAGKENGKG